MEENKENKSSKKLVFLYIVLLLTGIVLEVIYVYLMENDSKLYFSGRLFHPYIFMYIYFIIFFGQYIFIYLTSARKEQDKETRKKQLVAAVISSVMVIMSVCGTADNIYRGSKDPPRFVTESLSDGTEILLAERTDYIAGFEKKPENEHTYLDIYRLKGFAAMKIGKIDETYFSDKCLAQNKYTLDYSEETKTLTVSCEYGVYGNDFVHLKEEYDTGVLKYDFSLE